MMSLLIPLLKAVLCSGILLGYYLLFLRNKALHQFNRFYLLLTALLSVCLPFLHIGWKIKASDAAPVSVFHFIKTITDEGNELLPKTVSSFSLSPDVLMAVYIAVSTVLCLLLIVSIRKIFILKRHYKIIRHPDFYLIPTRLEEAPFSFFNLLFWNEEIDMESAAGKQILKHELVHIRQKHTYDKLFLQLATAVCWLNPFLWFIQKELSLIHEFIADDEAVNDNDPEAFALMLLQKHYGNGFTNIVHPFFQSPVKRRLIMLQSIKNLKYAMLRKFMLFPVLVVTTFLVSFELKDASVIKANKTIVLALDAGHGGKDNGAKSSNGVSEKELNLKVINKLAQLAEDYNIEVVKTRNGDDYPTLQERPKIANEHAADIFLSIHMSALEKNDERTLPYEMIINERNKHAEESKTLASSIASHLPKQEVSPILHQKHLVVLEHAAMPAVLLELGNMNNADQIGIINSDDTLEKLCREILSGIVDYYNSH